MELGPPLCSMGLTMSLWLNGGAMGSSSLWSILSSGLELEESGGSSLACGRYKKDQFATKFLTKSFESGFFFGQDSCK